MRKNRTKIVKKKNSDQIIRIQDNLGDYENKIFGQWNNELHYNIKFWPDFQNTSCQ